MLLCRSSLPFPTQTCSCGCGAGTGCPGSWPCSGGSRWPCHPFGELQHVHLLGLIHPAGRASVCWPFLTTVCSAGEQDGAGEFTDVGRVPGLCISGDLSHVGSRLSHAPGSLPSQSWRTSFNVVKATAKLLMLSCLRHCPATYRRASWGPPGPAQRVALCRDKADLVTAIIACVA